LITARITARRTVIRAVLIPLAGVFIVALLTVSSLSAAGGGIEVVETGAEVDFPGNVDLSVTAQGDADTVEG